MIEAIDAWFTILIKEAPSWKLTAKTMRLRHNWWNYFMKWSDTEKKWIKK